MKQIFVKKGRIVTDDVPAPLAGDNEALVQVYYSCISTGTETSAVKSSAESVFRKALNKPENIVKVLETLKKEGIKSAISRIKNELSLPQALGYSASGIVIEAGKNITDVSPGDRVACAGAGVATHSEFIIVPRNLLVRVPQGMSLEQASTVTLGSVAMQSIRRGAPNLGESVCVIGLGVLGQLAVQMLKANGCRVIGADIEQFKIATALSFGMDRGVNVNQDDMVEEVMRFSSGYGADIVIITASSKDNLIINRAMEMCRKKGKVVIVGAVGLGLKREEFYQKELDVLISTSYGPGRYDEKYERKGLDYPYAYVRWTENRNMAAYLELIAEGKINISPLISNIYPVQDAADAFDRLKSEKSLINLLQYNAETLPERKIVVSDKKRQKERLNVAVIGAGSFSQSTLLPDIGKLSRFYNIYAVSCRTGAHAKEIAAQYNARYASTDYKEMLDDEAIDMVVIATRHNLHAAIAAEAARAKKAVFLEKPMALNKKELDLLVKTLEETEVPFMVGFNRRFSPFAQKIKDILKNRISPMIINYRMNTGFIPKEHWVHSEEGGGGNIGEACHIYDLFNFFTESEVESLSARSINPNTEQHFKNDNFIATIKYKDGSVCNLVYTALGAKEAPKEKMDIYCDGKVISLNDYMKLRIIRKGKSRELTAKNRDRGHYQELKSFAQSQKNNNGYPIPLWQLVQAAEISFEVEERL